MKKLFTKEFLKKNIIAVVALVGVIMIAMVSVYAWTETISSLEIKTVKNGAVDTPIKTIANINSDDTAINLDDYFKESGNVHLASCSSPNGKDFYFPVITKSGKYRKNNINDKNVNYISFSLKVVAKDKNRTFYFRQAPTIKLNDKAVENTNNCVRMAFFLEDESKGIFSNSKAEVHPINSTSGDTTTDAVTINQFSEFTNSQKSLFTVNAGETKTLTVSLWLEDPNCTVDNSTVTVEGLELITESQKTAKFTFVDQTTAHNDQNDDSINSWHWVDNYSAKMWLYDGSKSYEMKKDASSDKWTADIKNSEYTSSTKLTFYRTKATVTDPTKISDDVWNKWETTYNSGKYTYTAFGSESNLGTWEDVVEITLNTEDNSVLPIPTKAELNKAAHISVLYKENNVDKTIQMCYHDNLWRCYIPKKITQLTFKAENPDDNNANKSTLNQASLTRGTETAYTVTSANTGYWGTGVLVKASVDSSCKGYGTATATVSVNGKDYDVNNKRVTKGTSVKFAATANSGYSFKEWKQGTTTIKGSTVTVAANSDLSYVAYFVKEYTLTAKATTGGTVKLKNGSTAGTTAKYTAVNNTTVTIANVFTATANEGYEFDGWYDAETGGNKVTQVTLNSNKTVYARFSVSDFTLTAHATTGGNVNLKSGGTAGSTAKYTASYNTSVTLGDVFTATANDGYTFDGWYDAETGGNKITQVKLSSDKDVYARFKANTRKVYLTNNYSWSTVYCFAWNSSTNNNNGNFPGLNMTYSYKNTYNQDVYVIEVPNNYNYVIFSNGSKQTVDIKLPDDGDVKYYISGESNGKYTVSTWT